MSILHRFWDIIAYFPKTQKVTWSRPCLLGVDCHPNTINLIRPTHKLKQNLTIQVKPFNSYDWLPQIYKSWLTPKNRATHCVTPSRHRAVHKAQRWVWSTCDGRRSTVDQLSQRSTCRREIRYSGSSRWQFFGDRLKEVEFVCPYGTGEGESKISG